MKISVDVERCIGAGQCVSTVSEVFAQSDEHGTVVLLQHEPRLELERKVREAADLCPANAIHIDK
jgi:ferredoxin